MGLTFDSNTRQHAVTYKMNKQHKDISNMCVHACVCLSFIGHKRSPAHYAPGGLVF